MPSNLGINFLTLSIDDLLKDDVLGSQSITGTNKADSLIWDATKSIGESAVAKLDGGAGNDDITIQLTQSQFDALKIEINQHAAVFVKADGTMIGDAQKAFSGNQWTHIDALNIDVKNWENVKLKVVADPVNAPVLHLSGNELVANWNFEMDNANNDQQFVRLEAPMGWVREGGSPQMEIGHGSGILGFGAGESQWLDTAASPGDIKIGTSSQWDPKVGTGVKAQLSVSVAAHSGVFTADNGVTSTYRPDADDHLLFRFNDTVVKDITLADFTTKDGVIDWNQFRDFTVDVTGRDGADHLTIESTGNTEYTDPDGVIHGYTGFAVDHVSIQEWVL